MKKLFFVLLMSTLFFACDEKSTTQPETEGEEWPYDPPSTEQLDAHAMAAKIGRGFNFGNSLESSTEDIYIKDEHIKIIADAGFTAIRLPVSWPTRCETEAPFTIWPEFFDRVDHVVHECLNNNFTVILNIHHFDALNEDPIANTDWILALWTQIAEHYKDYPDELYFELLNEPHGAFGADPAIWNTIANQLLDIVRQNNPYRMVVIGGIDWNTVSRLKDLDLPEEDRSIIGTFHCYDPFHFTHQGASWAGDDADSWLGTTWNGSPDERAAIDKVMQTAQDWAIENDRPVYLGEFGAYSTADMNSRYRWTDWMVRSAEEQNITWTYWEFFAGFGAWDRDANEWRPLLLKALAQL